MFYSEEQKRRIVSILQANSSILVVGETGCGKTTLAKNILLEVQEIGFIAALCEPAVTSKQFLIKVAKELGVDIENLDGKRLTTEELQEAIAEFLSKTSAFLICDDAHRYGVGIRYWLEKLYEAGQPMVLLADYPPKKDIFVKLPPMELFPLSDHEIRQIMREEAAARSLELSNAQLANLQERCGGNPMLAERVVREEHIGLDEPSPDHTQWVDITPFIIAGLMCLIIIRFLGLGFNSITLYLVGGILTVIVSVIRLLLYSLPRSKGGRRR